MNADKIRRYNILHFQDKFREEFPYREKCIYTAARSVAMTVFAMPPRQAPHFVIDFLIWHTVNFNLMDDHMEFKPMINDFFNKVKYFLHQVYPNTQKYWYKFLNIEITRELADYIEAEHKRHVEERRYSVKDLVDDVGCSRRTAYNYLEKYNFDKDENGDYKFTYSELNQLVTAIKAKAESIQLSKVRPEFRYIQPEYDPYYAGDYD